MVYRGVPREGSAGPGSPPYPAQVQHARSHSAHARRYPMGGRREEETALGSGCLKESGYGLLAGLPGLGLSERKEDSQRVVPGAVEQERATIR